MDSTNKKEMLTAFVLPIVYCKFPEFTKSDRAFRMFIMMLRYDNSIGLIGGRINKNESVLEGLKRETLEESFIDLSLVNDSLIKISEFAEENNNYKIRSHFYCINMGVVETEEVKKLVSRANLSQSSISEGNIIAVHAYGKHYKKLRNKCNIAVGVDKELDQINKKYSDYINI